LNKKIEDKERKKMLMNEENKSEKEIKENCIIEINNEIIPFSYYYKFEKKGKYIIKYLFKQNLTNCNFMFYKYYSLESIDLSNFNTQNITDMSDRFIGCYSFESIDLSNFNTKNVTDMSYIFMDVNL